MRQSAIIWGLILIFGFPLINVAFGEGVEWLQRRGSPLAQFFLNVRRWIFPPLAILLVMCQILGFKASDRPVQIVETILWFTTLYTALSLLNVLLTAGSKQRSWQIRVPNLLFQFARTLIVLTIIAYVIGIVWKIDLSSVLTALGVGSLVIALALQDTLSNLVSGFLLIFEAPFKVGDWIHIQNLEEGEVIEINWRAVRLKNRERDIVVIPNGLLGKEIIYNYTLVDPVHAERVHVSFSYDELPNKVKQVLESAAFGVEGILSDPPPNARTRAYGAVGMEYELKYYLTEFARADQIRYELLTRIYYAAKRNHLTIALPVQIDYLDDSNTLKKEVPHQEILEFLRSLPYFMSLDHPTVSRLGEKAIVEYYGIGEEILEAGEFNQRFYIIRNGSVRLTVTDTHNRQQEIAQLSKGDFFGEMALLRGEASAVSVRVLDDLSVLVIEPDLVLDIAQKSSKFALEMNQFVEERRKAVRLAQGVYPLSGHDKTSNGQESAPLLQRLLDISDT